MLFGTLSLCVLFSLVTAFQFLQSLRITYLFKKGWVLYLSYNWEPAAQWEYFSGSCNSYFITVIFLKGTWELWGNHLWIQRWGWWRLVALWKLFPYGHGPNYSYLSLALKAIFPLLEKKKKPTTLIWIFILWIVNGSLCL